MHIKEITGINIEKFKNNIKVLINYINNNDYRFLNKSDQNYNKYQAKLFIMMLGLKKIFNSIINNSNYNEIRYFIANIKNSKYCIDKCFVENIEKELEMISKDNLYFQDRLKNSKNKIFIDLDIFTN